MPLWDLNTGDFVKFFEAKILGNQDVFDVHFSRDSRTIIGTAYNFIRLWDVDSGKNTENLKGNTYKISLLDISPDGPFFCKRRIF